MRVSDVHTHVLFIILNAISICKYLLNMFYCFQIYILAILLGVVTALSFGVANLNLPS